MTSQRVVQDTGATSRKRPVSVAMGSETSNRPSPLQSPRSTPTRSPGGRLRASAGSDPRSSSSPSKLPSLSRSNASRRPLPAGTTVHVNTSPGPIDSSSALALGAASASRSDWRRGLPPASWRHPRCSPARRPVAMRSPAPEAAPRASRSNRARRASRLSKRSVTCWPSTGARPVGNAKRKASSARTLSSPVNCGSSGKRKLPLAPRRNSRRVGTDASWVNPKPRTCSPRKGVGRALRVRGSKDSRVGAA